MKFLIKDPKSPILREGMTYKENKSANNRQLLDALIKEQRGFCAYTDRYIGRSFRDATEVEHLNPALKYKDNYFNYYAVLRDANRRKTKKERQPEFKHASFLENLFFQNYDALFSRIRYVPEDHVYEAMDENDDEAEALIDYLGMNSYTLVKDRTDHVERIVDTCRDCDWSSDAILTHFINRPAELSFITALELRLSIDLSSAIPETPLALDSGQ